MHLGQRVVCVIPARLHSTRLDKKVLKRLGDKTLLQRVYERALACNIFDDVILAVDAQESLDIAQEFGAKVCMTSTEHRNGTERLLEIYQRKELDGDVWVNWQADEPFIRREMILDLLQSIDQPGEIWTLRKKMQDMYEIMDPNVVKVVVDKHQRALYFSRYPLPYERSSIGEAARYKHVGLYAYTSEALEKIAIAKECDLERAESLEQLRFLYEGMTIQVHETIHQSLGIDLAEHLAMAEQLLVSLN